MPPYSLSQEVSRWLACKQVCLEERRGIEWDNMLGKLDAMNLFLQAARIVEFQWQSMTLLSPGGAWNLTPAAH